MKATIELAAVLGILAFAGCGGKQEQTTTTKQESSEPATPPSGEGHAEAGVVPGSYEDWCSEHEVPETQCTRCNPALIPAFQAAGDWDADHGLPMSQCKIHNPNLKIVRPPKPEGM